MAYMMEWHSGYPYSLQDGDGRVSGPVNSHRLPNFFELNVHLERRFVFRGHRWAWRGGANNITNSKNPSMVYNIEGPPHYGQFCGASGRVFNIRIRWLGRE